MKSSSYRSEIKLTIPCRHLPTVTVSVRPARMTMLFDFFKKKAVVTKTDEKFKPLTGSAVSD